MQNTYTFKQHFLLIILFGFLALSLFSPIASNEYLPNSQDFLNHIVSISEAKQALDQGQFPIRVAPDLYQHWQYPHYQFYSPLAYTIAGAIHQWLVPQNPFIAYKITLWLALLLAGIFVFRLTLQFVESRFAALLSATLYLFSPYLMLNIGVRGDFTEALATCLVPLTLYYSIQCHNKPALNMFIATALAWFALATIHLVTFIFSSLFIGIFLICLNVQNNIPLKNLMMVGLAYGFSGLLAAWYWAPIILLQPYLYIHHALANPYYTNWLNPLSTLLSPSAVSPMPLPGNGKLPFPFYVGIGWPILIAVGVVIYKKVCEPTLKMPTFVTPLLFLFIFAFFITWSPVNFWAYIPEYFKSLQFGFRILIQLMWMGALLFGWVIIELFQNKLDIRHIVLGILLIGIANGSWLLTGSSNDKKVADLVQHPALYEWGARAYVISPLLFPHAPYPAHFLSVTQTEHICYSEKSKLTCQISLPQATIIQLPLLYYPNMLTIKVDGQSVHYQPIAATQKIENFTQINPLLASISLSQGTHTITAQFTGLKWANWISLSAWIGLLIALIWARAPNKCKNKNLY